MEQLTGLDAAFVHQESRRSPMHVTAVLVYDIGGENRAGLTLDQLQEFCSQRLAGFPLFRRRLQKVPMGMDTPYWVGVTSPDWQHQIREVLLESAGWQDFQGFLADFHGSQLNLKRPLWEIQLVHGLKNFPGLPDNCQALVLKAHHAAIDGMSLAAIIGGLHDEGPDFAAASHSGFTEPSEWALWNRANLNLLNRQFKLVDTVRNLVPGLLRARKTRQEFSDLPPIYRGVSCFNDRVDKRRVTGAVLLPKNSVLEVKRKVRRVTLNDIALAVVGGALRHYLAAHGQTYRESLASGAPINLRGTADEKTGGNKTATMVVGLATQLEDPVERLRLVHQYAVAGKKTINALGTGTVMDISDSVTPGLLAEGIRTMAWASKFADAPVPFHTMVSNVPGPPGKLCLGSAELVVSLGLGPIRDNLGLFHIVSGGPDLMSISFTSCESLLPDGEFYEQCLRNSFEALLKAARSSAD